MCGSELEWQCSGGIVEKYNYYCKAMSGGLLSLKENGFRSWARFKAIDNMTISEATDLNAQVL